MAEQQLTLTTEERNVLVNLLETALKDARIEEHRTRAPAYREFILKQENAIIGILAKLGSATN